MPSSSRKAEEAAEYVDEIPPVFESASLSLRGFDADGMMADAILTQPGEADAGSASCSTIPRSRHSRAQCDARLLRGED